MDPREYQREVTRTQGRVVNTRMALNLCGLGITGEAGEAGEVADIIKKFNFHGHPLQAHKLMEELGDVMWYVAALCNALSIELGDVMTANIDKLRRRYPEGFSCQKSLERSTVGA